MTPEIFPSTSKACLPSANVDTARIAIGVEYNGSLYHGWQRQALPQIATVQHELEKVLSNVANHEVKLHCAGRTDAGVHASGQVAHFDVAVERELKAWVKGANSQLPSAIRVLWAAKVDEQFHARFSATSRRYHYWIHNSAVRPGVFAGLLTHCAFPLDTEVMHREAQCLLGERDFSSFRAAGCQSNTAMRNIHHIRVFRQAERVCIDIQANAFLLHMVRNIAGALMAVGGGKEAAGWVQNILQAKDRTLSSATAKPDGLYLTQVGYPPELSLPIENNSLF